MEALNKRLSREEGGKIKMARNASTIVSEILNNVSALSGVLDNSQNLASTSTTPSTTVEEEVRRLFHPGSVRNDSNVIYQHENLCENGMNQLTSVQRQISQQGQSQTMLASTGVQANGFSRPVTNSKIIRRNETSQTPNQLQDDFVNNLGQVNQQSETMGCNGNLTSYVPRRFNFTRNRGKRNCKAKAPNIKGNSCFYKEIVLLTGPNDTVTPRQGTKLYLKRNKQIVRGVQFSKQWSEDQVTQQVKSLFGSKLLECSFEFLESVYTDFVPPTLPPGESFNGMMFCTTFRDKIVYVRPQDQVIPPPPKVARSKKSKKTASVFEETLHDSDDSTISEFGTERSADEENEILQAKGLSTVENSSNTVVDVISDPSISESLVSQNSNSSNTNTEQEISPVIDLTSDYEYAALFDE